MDHIERVHWIEACQMFFDAYVKFQIDRTEAQAYGVGKMSCLHRAFLVHQKCYNIIKENHCSRRYAYVSVHLRFQVLCHLFLLVR